MPREGLARIIHDGFVALCHTPIGAGSREAVLIRRREPPYPHERGALVGGEVRVAARLYPVPREKVATIVSATLRKCSRCGQLPLRRIQTRRVVTTI